MSKETKKLSTAHADLALKMVGRLEFDLRRVFVAIHGFGGVPLTLRQVSNRTGIGAVTANRMYDMACEMISVAIDSDDVEAGDVPMLVSIGLMRCDEPPEWDFEIEARLSQGGHGGAGKELDVAAPGQTP